MKIEKLTGITLALMMGASVSFAQDKPTPKLPPEATEFWEPIPKVVTPGKTSQDAPSDAIVLFNGADLSNWVSARDNGFPKWEVKDGKFTVVKGTGDIQTKQGFGDMQLHIEWTAPTEIVGESQGRGNSGLFLMGMYEVQILDNFNNRTYSNGQAGSVYKQFPPLVNAMRAPGEWNTYDVIFRAPRFDKNGMLIRAARVTVIHNGVLVQDNMELKGPTEYIGIPQYKAHADKLPIRLQDHGNPVSFRNIWVRPLD